MARVVIWKAFWVKDNLFLLVIACGFEVVSIGYQLLFLSWLLLDNVVATKCWSGHGLKIYITLLVSIYILLFVFYENKLHLVLFVLLIFRKFSVRL